MRRLLVVLALAVGVVGTVAGAEVKPSALFSDHAVLQNGVAVPVWGTAEAGEKVAVSIAGQTQKATAGADGRWMVRLKKLKTGGPFEMTIAGKNTVTVHDVLVGEVWVGSGQSNMVFTVAKKKGPYGLMNEEAEIAAANYPTIRIFMATTAKTYEPAAEIAGEWKVCTPENAPDFSAVAYLFARSLQKELKVPVGMLVVAYGASTAESWVRREALMANPELAGRMTRFDGLESFYKGHPGATTDQVPAEIAAPKTINARPGKPGPLRDPAQDQHQPMVLFNGMVHPILPYAMRGVIWYQGESIVGGKAGLALYPATMEMLVKDWRGLWGEGDFPFYVVQLAALNDVSNNPLVREGQSKILALPKTGMAVTIDIGDPKDVHPHNKAPLGDRLARIALAQTYGKKMEYAGPRYVDSSVTDDSVVVKFDHAAGLMAKGGALKGFQVAGPDRVFVDAEATIKGDTVEVKSAKAPIPVAVRYAWANYPEGVNLYNGDGLPAAPFRTDNWDASAAVEAQMTAK
jgi:sialate O-acetylesterase